LKMTVPQMVIELTCEWKVVEPDLHSTFSWDALDSREEFNVSPFIVHPSMCHIS